METPRYVEKIILEPKASMEMSSPFKDVSVAFNWLNRDYPIYHEHTHWELLVVMTGEISHNINGTERMLKRGEACLIRPTDQHSLTLKGKQKKKQYQQVNFTFSDAFARKLLNIYDGYEKVLRSSEPVTFSLEDSELSMIYDKALLAQNLPKEDYEMSTKVIISRAVATYFEQRILFDTAYPDWLNEFIKYINNPIAFDKSTQELATHTPYSYSRLSTLFKQYVGMTIVDYMNGKKMVYAKRLLKTTNFTTLQISEQIGYSSLSSFNHLFKDTFAITPSEYRKRHKRLNKDE